MNDIEIESLLEQAGYQYDTVSGRYGVLDGDDGGDDFPTEDVSDQLGIPLDDLLRWEEEQQQQDVKED